jgi:hypothetical protein
MIDLETQRPLVLTPTRYVLLPLANLITGYSVKAMERKIERGDWQEGKVWRRAPGGHIMIDIVGYQKWVESSLTGNRISRVLFYIYREQMCCCIVSSRKHSTRQTQTSTWP